MNNLRWMGGSLLARWLYMLIASPMLIFLFSSGSRMMMRQDPRTRYSRGFISLWSALGQRDVLPTLGSIGRAVLRYFVPSFHPRTEGNIAVAEAYLQFLYSPEAQEISAKNFYRPTDQAVAAKYKSQYIFHFRMLQ